MIDNFVHPDLLESQEPNAAAKPAPNLAHDLPTPQLNFDSVVQHNSSRSPTPRLKSNRPKRRHSGETGDKARLVPQDVLTTRVAIQEKDRMIEMLKDEVSD